MNIPDAYKNCVNLKTAYLLGRDNGHGLACHNVPKIGSCIWTEYHGYVDVTIDNVKSVHESLCFMASDNSRSYSPFEVMASKFNSFDGGFHLYFDGEIVLGPFESEEEATQMAALEGIEYDSVEESPNPDEMWEAFETGISDAIFIDLEEYSLDDYPHNDQK